jgi:hypothetical protein
MINSWVFFVLTTCIYFMEQIKNVQIRFWTFERLKLWFIKRLTEFNSCCCNYHVQMAKIKDGFNAMHTEFFNQNCTCICNICRPHGEVATPCIANNNVVSGVRNMCEHILCLMDEHMNSTSWNVSKAIVLTMTFQHSNSTFVKLITILTQKYQGINLKRFQWRG